MDTEMESTPTLFDPENLSAREKYRRYRKRQSSSNVSPFLGSSSSKFTETSLLFDGNSNGIQRPPNAALLLEEIKQEVDSHEFDDIEASTYKAPDSNRRRVSADRHGTPGLSVGLEPSTMALKQEDDVLMDVGESSFSLFSSLLDSALQGLIPFADLILHFEKTCRSISESIRFGGIMRHRIVEDKLMRRKAQLLLDEAASWSLIWHLFGKGNDDLPENLILTPPTSHQEACQFVVSDITAQLCLRIVLWLEGLASEALDLDKKVKGSHVGTYLPSSGVWHHTQRYLKKKNDDPSIIKHLDFDAATREASQEIYDDRKQDESLLEDIWILLRAGRVEEACELCRSAGQPWRAATLCPFGGLDLCPSVEALQKNGNNRTFQAFELEGGVGRQWLLWKWASYCASEKAAKLNGGKYEIAVFASRCSNLKCMLPVCTDWESACWALAKSLLDVQVDSVLEQFQRRTLGHAKNFGDDTNGSSQQGVGTSQSSDCPGCWPGPVINQQPRDIFSLVQKLHSVDIVHESVARACKEQHRQIEINLMKGDLAHLLDLLWSWISPSEDDQNVLRPHGDPQIIRFSAHLVLIFRYLVADEVKDALREKLFTVGDLIIHMYAMFLFSKQHDELIGIYASQLARHRCIDFFVQIMELRSNDSVQVKYKIFHSAMEYLPFCPDDDQKACFEDIIESVLSRSREIKKNKNDGRSSDVAEQHRMQSVHKAMAIQWLCFTPPSTLGNFRMITIRLLMKALMHSNILFREFSLISMWRVPKMPVGAHKLLSFLVEPLKHSLDDQNVYEDMQEFEDWREYYACDATYRNWLKVELENADVAELDLSVEEKDRAVAVAQETLDSSLKLLLREEHSWLYTTETSPYNINDCIFVELHATATLCLPSGECLRPDATLCTSLSSALYSSVSEGDILKRQLAITVTISPEDDFCIGVSMRCMAVDGDGLGLHETGDGGILAKVLASGFKGELSRFHSVALEISRLDAWYSTHDGSLECPATYVVKGLCRRCCLPEMILRCMQVSVSLCESRDSTDCRSQLIDLVTDPQAGMLNLFSQKQLQEFILFERECSLYRMEFHEESSLDDT